MKNQDTYIKNKVQNTFTAYLVKAVKGVRNKYLANKNRIAVHENFLHDAQGYELYQKFEDLIDIYENEMQERDGGINQFFGGLDNDKLFQAVMLLKDSEREIIYLHVFEEKTFREIGSRLNKTESIVKGRYYYALTKIRKWMEEGANEF